MIPIIRLTFISLIISSISFADVFMTELSDPQNSSDAGRFVELYNNGDSAVDLSTYSVQRWTNANTDPTASSIVELTGTVSAGGFYIICNDAAKYNTTYGLTCDQDIGTGGFADSNGDDNMALLDGTGIVDIFGVPGEDGTGTGHEFEDGRAERAEFVTAANPVWDVSEWNVDNDSGGGDGNQYAPEGFDPGAWIGAEEIIILQCEDESACNFMADGACEYPEYGFDCDGNCIVDFDCAGVCGGDAEYDECGECGGNGSACADPAANLFFSEHAEGSSSNKYFEIYNASDSAVDLANYNFVNCSNGCDDWEYTNTFAEGAVVEAGDVYVVCHSSADAEGILPFCDETRTLYHNGDDAQGLVYALTGELLDVYGAIGEDPGSGWEVAGVSNATKDHTLVRKSEVVSGNTDWALSAGTTSDDSEWLVFDQNTWDYIGSHPHDFSSAGCTDELACNFDPDATEDDGSCLFNDCLGECGGSAVEDDCGVCEGDGSSCSVIVEFSVDMSLSEVSGDVTFRVATVNGEYNPSDWVLMSDVDGDFVFTYATALTIGYEYGYNFNNSGYESGDNLGECAGGNYGNDRVLIVGEDDMVLDTVCWESCDACPEVILGCTDESALNYDENATEDDGSCIYEWPEPANLFFSEAAEGSSNNKYLEIYNASDSDVDLSGYSLSSCSNGCNETDVWDYADNVTFEAGTILTAGDVFVVCHQSSDEFILAECDQNFTYLSNGDDVFALTQIGSGTVLDIIGTTGDDPGSGWEVAGVSNATKDHTLVRKASVATGNTDWASSAGTDADDSEWVVLDQNTWDYLGSHPHEFAPPCDCASGDLTCDGTVNVTDIVGIVNYILFPADAGWDDCQISTSDFNADGIVNVTDIIGIVNLILGGGRIDSDASFNIYNNTIQTSGAVAGIQVEGKLVSNVIGNDVVAYGNGTTIIYSLNGKLETQMFTFDSNPSNALVVSSDETELTPSSMNLLSSFPNPFNPQTTINFDIAVDGFVNLTIYDLLGQKVSELVNSELNANEGYSVVWSGQNMSGSDVPSGIYIARLTSGNSVNTQKLTLLR